MSAAANSARPPIHIENTTLVPTTQYSTLQHWPTDESGTPGWESERNLSGSGDPRAGGRPVEVDWRVDAFVARKSEEQWIIWHAITSMLSRSALVTSEQVG
jgi:hypothetical protein